MLLAAGNYCQETGEMMTAKRRKALGSAAAHGRRLQARQHHILIRHRREIEELTGQHASELWHLSQQCKRAVREAEDDVARVRQWRERGNAIVVMFAENAPDGPFDAIFTFRINLQMFYRWSQNVGLGSCDGAWCASPEGLAREAVHQAEIGMIKLCRTLLAEGPDGIRRGF